MPMVADVVRPRPPLRGFGNHFSSEALPGALPQGRNSPQRAPLGLYAELLSGSAFTAPRGENRRTWVYRIRPSAAHHAPFEALPSGLLRTAPCHESPTPPQPLRWDAITIPDEPLDFVDGLATLGTCGDARLHQGAGIHLYRANRGMGRRAFYNADGELLLVPQQGRLALRTELGVMDLAPGHIGVVPRGLRFAVELPDGPSRGYVCENHGAMLRLPELGPIGSNGLANPRDFSVPQAAFTDDDGPWTLTVKQGGRLWRSTLAGSPFDVVGWHGNLVPYAYDLANFMAIGSISFDHPDPSINTVLTSPSEQPGTANVDLVVFPPRWLVAEDTFRPPWFHRNAMSEFMGLVHGVYDAKAEGFVPGGASLHNGWTAHGPDDATYERAAHAALAPHKLDHTLAFMFETRFLIEPTAWALQAHERQAGYTDCWAGLRRHFQGGMP